jgi:hypothetical protein
MPQLLFTENETNHGRLYGIANGSHYVKDGINDAIVHGLKGAVNPAQTGTKVAAHYPMTIGPGETTTVRLRFTLPNLPVAAEELLTSNFDRIFADRQREANEFYATVIPEDLSADAQQVMRQGFGGLLWSKQFYHYVVKDWLDGDEGQAPPPGERRHGRNHEWAHLYNADVISMPDKWEYPWYAAWDLAFHCVPLALIDSEFAKEQLVLMTREWYMHPNGQLPAYEWAFGDVNPPVHAWATWRVYKIDKKRRGKGDTAFLKRVFQKLLLNFTWWVNRKDAEGKNIFQGGFLGLDNIGVFDRSSPLPTGGHIEQSDGTGWMAMYTLNLLAIAMELAREDSSYEDVASKFWEHFVYIADAMNHRGHDGIELWNEEDGFFYDVLHLPNGEHFPMKVRSMVGLIPLFAVETLEPEELARVPEFRSRLKWLLEHRKDLAELVAEWATPGIGHRRLIAMMRGHRMKRVLSRMLDETQFLSDYGIRSLSKLHLTQPVQLNFEGRDYRLSYEPGESETGLFGGNSNWRGPIWFPVNYLIVESLQKFHHYYGDDFKIECPTGSGKFLTLLEVAEELGRRLSRIFLRNADGRRPVFGSNEKLQTDPQFRDYLWFNEYFHGDSGRGLGASHQTGWTALVAKLLQPKKAPRTSPLENQANTQTPNLQPSAADASAH